MSPIRRFAFLLLLCACFCKPTVAQQTAPKEVGMSAERLQFITDEAERRIEEDNLVGMVNLVARRGKVVYLKASGWQNREEKVRMKTNTIFRVASFTKPVTSLAVLALYESGKLQLTDPLSKYIPEFKQMKVVKSNGAIEDAVREITIYDLLTHNSGLAYENHLGVGHLYREAGINTGLRPDEDPIGKDIRALARIPLSRQPGSGFQYGHSIDVLGHVVEVVSGQTLAEFFNTRFFGPLAMKDTKFFLGQDDASRLAQLYTRVSRNELVPEHRDLSILAGYEYGGNTPFKGPRVSYSGGGGLCSTCEDYFRFCQMVLDKGEYGGKRILSRKTVEQATIPHLPIAKGFFCEDSSDFGLGFAVQRSTGTPRPGSPGTLRWGSIFNGFFFIDPKEDLVGITIGQIFPGEGEWAETFMQLTYGAVAD